MGVLLLALLTACGGTEAGTDTAPGGDGSVISVADPWVRAAARMDIPEGEADGEMEGMGGSTSAAYMTLSSATGESDALVSASTDAAETVELHTVIMEEGVMRMRPVTQIEVPAEGETHLEPGGYHVMLINITRDLSEGDTVELTLTFEQAGEVQVTAPVRQSIQDMDTMDNMEDSEQSEEQADETENEQ
jgi:hypothetical protein